MKLCLLLFSLIGSAWSYAAVASPATQSDVFASLEIVEYYKLQRFDDDVTEDAARSLADENKLAKVIPYGRYFDAERSKLKARILYPEGVSAKVLAEAIWTALAHDDRFREVDCGSYGLGEVKVKGVQSSSAERPKFWKEYEISYTGDGGINTCTGRGGPGWASYHIDVVIVDEEKRHALLEVESSEE